MCAKSEGTVKRMSKLTRAAKRFDKRTRDVIVNDTSQLAIAYSLWLGHVAQCVT